MISRPPPPRKASLKLVKFLMFDCLKRTLQLFFDIMLSAHISKLSTVVATTLFYFLQTSRKDAIPPGTLKKVIEQAHGEKKNNFIFINEQVSIDFYAL